MFRPCAAARRPGSCAFGLIVSGLAIWSFFASSVVAGELRDDEVSIGTFNLNPPPVRTRSETQGPLGGDSSKISSDALKAPAPAADVRTAELFDDALAALNSGRNDVAQRLFERLIAEAPDSTLARDARGHLADLYRTAPRNSLAERGESVGAADGKPVRPRPLSDAAKLGGAATPVDKDGGGTEVAAAIEEQFIAEAGDRVFFSAGSAELGTRARGVLQAQARFIKLRPGLAATIEGHADDAPLSADEHARLSAARAEAVRQRLIEEGIESNRLAVASWGRDRRISECPEAACAAQNRRAVTVLIGGRARRTDGPASLRPGAESVVAREPALLTH
jgi:peptidoglycan-associated lipoprotein